MNKPWIIWSLSALCAVLVFGAMGVITRHTLGLEKDRAEAEARAELEERIRLSLWRMDTTAAGILAEENNRPAWHFRDVDIKNPTRLTPLNLNVPDKVKLHFEVDGIELSTPQINGWVEPSSNWDRKLSQVRQGSELSEQKTSDWFYLQNLLLKDQTYLGWQAERNVLNDLADNNLGLVCAVAQRDGILDEVIPLNGSANSQAVSQVVKARAENAKGLVRSKVEYQNSYNTVEKSKRQQIVQKSVGNGEAKKNSWAMPSKGQTKAKDGGGVAGIIKAGDSPVASVAPEENDVLPDKNLLEGAHLSPLRPIWLAGNLILVRDVQDNAGRRVQGVWLNTEEVRLSLLGNIADLLPNARLEPVEQGLRVMLGEERDPAADDPMVMAALPWRLVPGEAAVVTPAGWTPMRKTLGVAWVGALLAAIAAVVLLRGVVKLSERRASFVSSVTHELRTPLTTFGLYSDMLAEGMVKDEVKQKEYLNTLRKESSRLTHLVENVLAYSRIERGSARARVEKVGVGTLIDRICERLRSRAEEAGMELHCELTPEVAAEEIQIDTTAVEQILFNLVDNASKYASGDDHGNVIELRALETSKGIAFRVCDQGPGIAKSEHRKLFRAFHKSAQEAAHTKPGVGLGLALCRRLARALGGDLRIMEQDKGACFELSLCMKS